MTVLICILGLMSAVLALAPTGASVLVCTGIGSACGVWILYALISGSIEVRLTSLLASSLMIGFFGGTFYPVLMASLAGRDLMTYIGLDAAWVAYALLLATLACMALLVVGSGEPPLIQERHVVEMSWRQERFLWIAVALVAFGYWSGRLSIYGMTGNSLSGKINVLDAVIHDLAGLVPALGAVGFMQSSGFRRIRFGAIVCAGLIGTFPVGRRVFGYALLLAVFAGLRLSGKSVTAGKKVLLGAGVIAAVLVSSFLFVGLRMATYQFSRFHTIWQIFQNAERTSYTNPQKVLVTLGQNVDYRSPGVTSYLAMLARNGNSAAPLYGQDAALAVERSFPQLSYHIVNVSKEPVIERGREEDLANEHFGFQDYDVGLSILSGGFIDFGLAGVLIYPLLLCVLARGVFWALSPLLNSEAQVLVILYIVSLLLPTESEIAAYLSAFRDTAVLLVVWAAIYYLPVLLARRRERAPAFSQ